MSLQRLFKVVVVVFSPFIEYFLFNFVLPYLYFHLCLLSKGFFSRVCISALVWSFGFLALLFWRWEFLIRLSFDTYYYRYGQRFVD